MSLILILFSKSEMSLKFILGNSNVPSIENFVLSVFLKLSASFPDVLLLLFSVIVIVPLTFFEVITVPLGP